MNREGWKQWQEITEGNEIARDVVETTGDPAKVELTPDRRVITADGYDLSYITVDITDAGRQGCAGPLQTRANFQISGKREDRRSGQRRCHGSDRQLQRKYKESVQWKGNGYCTVHGAGRFVYFDGIIRPGWKAQRQPYLRSKIPKIRNWPDMKHFRISKQKEVSFRNSRIK